MAPSQIPHRHVQGEGCRPAVGLQTQLDDEVREICDSEAHRSEAVPTRRMGTRRDVPHSWSTNLTLNQPWFYNALVIVVVAWILHGFVEALLAASVIAIASWPLYMRFVNRVGPRLSRGAAS